jgi:hypothetical protein
MGEFDRANPIDYQSSEFERVNKHGNPCFQWGFSDENSLIVFQTIVFGGIHAPNNLDFLMIIVQERVSNMLAEV